MKHLVSPLPRNGEPPLNLQSCYTQVKQAHDYLARQGKRALDHAAKVHDGDAWGSSLKRARVTLDDGRPAIIQADGDNHNLVEVINQCATMERLLYALSWALEQPELRELRVKRCHPTTSSTADGDDNDLVLVDASDRVRARFEVSDVVGARDGNGKERADLVSLGAVADAERTRTSPPPDCRLFLVVSERMVKWLAGRTLDDRRAERRGYRYEIKVEESVEDAARGGTAIVEVIRRPPSFLEAEKARVAAIKPELVSPDANRPGSYRKIARTFCVPPECAAENLHAAVRDEALAYFRDRSIRWHDSAGPGLPSNHLCCSQVACVNTLWPLTRDSDLLGRVFRPFLPQLEQVIPFVEDGKLLDGSKPLLAFEWIGQHNYLGERGWGTRGANATSADFAFRYRRTDGRTEIVLGEWKYTESYVEQLPLTGEPKKTQLATYHDAFARWRERQPGLPPYEAFFVEPFYQLMRLTLLAQEMEHTRGQGSGLWPADRVSVLHIAPAANSAFAQRVTSPPLLLYGNTVQEIWGRIAPPDRFVPVTTESLLQTIARETPASLQGWRDYLLLRYGWWRS